MGEKSSDQLILREFFMECKLVIALLFFENFSWNVSWSLILLSCLVEFFSWNASWLLLFCFPKIFEEYELATVSVL
jgi:hypothetical protein